MVLDYAKVCGACSTPLDSPPRDGTDSMCAYLHTRAGRREFERTLKRNRGNKAVIDAVATVAQPSPDATPSASPTPDATVKQPDDATLVADATKDATLGDGDATPTPETRSQRHRRLKREHSHDQP